MSTNRDENSIDPNMTKGFDEEIAECPMVTVRAMQCPYDACWRAMRCCAPPQTGNRTSPRGDHMTARVLVTGSRDWTDADTIRLALSDAWHMLGRPHDAVLVQGECHLGGADKIAADTWRAWGYPVEGHPAEVGPDGHVLGPERNARMVALGADVCLAFPLPSSRGTHNCMRLAREAGIPVRVYKPRTTS